MATKTHQRLGERDLELLRFAAEHRLVLAEHARVLLEVSPSRAQARLRALVKAGLLIREPVFAQRPPCFQITRTGLGLIGSQFAPPRLDLHTYDHDIGLAWLWLAARRGRFGALTDVVSERQLRSADARRDPTAAPVAVTLAGTGPSGRPRLHYPDLVLVTASGHRVAVELELTSKTRARREKILMSYAGDRRFDAVLYLVEKQAIGREIATCAAKLGAGGIVHVQLASLRSPPHSARGRTLERDRKRAGRPHPHDREAHVR
ncbi:MAG: hypothetical protein JOZ73_08035 [Solirubrobacterales bacterium]|nr:hypothetical protein [Solirubrobacterales bacterium]